MWWYREGPGGGRCRVGELLLSGGGAVRRAGGIWGLSVGATCPTPMISGGEIEEEIVIQTVISRAITAQVQMQNIPNIADSSAEGATFNILQ